MTDDRFAAPDVEDGGPAEPHQLVATASVDLVMDEGGRVWRIRDPAALVLDSAVVCNYGLHSDDPKARDACEMWRFRAQFADVPTAAEAAEAFGAARRSGLGPARTR